MKPAERLAQSLVVHVRARIDTVFREFATEELALNHAYSESHLRKSNVETRFNLLQDFLVVGTADEGDTETLGTEATSTSDTVQV